MRYSQEDHRYGRCEEELCIAWFKAEMSLELPEDLPERNAFYEKQRKSYNKWYTALFSHRWTLAEEKCQNCKAETLVVNAMGINLCVMWCLNTPIPFYPTGLTQPKAIDLIDHAIKCKHPSNSHSSYLISKYSASLKTAFTFSSHKTSIEMSESTSSSKEKTKTKKRSSSHSHLPNLDLSNHL